jgi:MCM P-loop domain
MGLRDSFDLWIPPGKKETASGEIRGRCPKCNHNNAEYNFKKGVWNCFNCEGGGSVLRLARELGLISNVRNINTSRKSTSELTEENVEDWHQRLLESKGALDRFQKKRGLSLATIKQFQIGYQSPRFTVPIRDENDVLINVRKYITAQPNPQWGAKWINLTGGESLSLFPLSQLENDDILIVEGELDALICIQHGIPTVSSTGGAGRWNAVWNPLFIGKNVSVYPDNDEAGIASARKVGKEVLRYANSVRLLDPLIDKPKGDITDWFMEAGGTATKLRTYIATVPMEVASDQLENSEPVLVSFQKAMRDGRLAGKPIMFDSQIVGMSSKGYYIPTKIDLNCDMAYKPEVCRRCTMIECSGERSYEIKENNIELIRRLIDIPEPKLAENIRFFLKIQKCPNLDFMVSEEKLDFEDLRIRATLEADDKDNRTFSIYSGRIDEENINSKVRITGTSSVIPRDSSRKFFAWNVEPLATPIDEFEVTPEIKNELKIFQPKEDQTVLQKCREISIDLINNVTHIFGRERMHMAMELVWHSALAFNFNNKPIGHGWLQLLIVGDTRTGKSETAKGLAKHFQIGEPVGCETTSLPGLIGAAQPVNRGEDWIVSWGKLPLLDKTLVILDELGGLSIEAIGSLSQIRTDGVAEINKAAYGKVNARVRLIAMGNARIDGLYTGIDKIENLIGKPEDISRFDLAMSVNEGDVPFRQMNKMVRKTKQIYTSDLCHNLILWIWSRKSNQIVFTPEAQREIIKGGYQLSSEFEPSPPLIISSDVREKIARIAVAFAGRTFSCDRTGEKIVVEIAHVEAAIDFIFELYSYPNFGYLEKSQMEIHRRTIAKLNKDKVRRYLNDKNQLRLLDFLLQNMSGFMPDDLWKTGAIFQDTASEYLAGLKKLGMIRKEKNLMILEKELIEVLRELRGFDE